MSDGVRLYGLVSRLAPDVARPVILTLSTYGLPVPNQGVPLSHEALCAAPAVDQQVVDEEAAERFTRVIFHIRGSGASEGLWDMMGPRTQRDVDEVIDWVSRQPWSDGDVLLFGMSGPALFTFHGLDHPAVKAAVVESTCSDFYRACTRHGGGLMEIGHGFMGLVEAAYSGSLPLRLRHGLFRNPTPAEQVAALAQTNVDFASHDLYDDWHVARSSHRLLPNVRIPVYFTTDPYDIIPASIYDAYEVTPRARLSLGKGHTTPTAGRLPSLLQGPIDRFVRHYMLGEDNGAESEPPVTLLLTLGSRADYASGRVLVRTEASWPLTGTRWQRLFLGEGERGSASSLNDGRLGLDPPEDASGSDVTPVAPISGPKTDLRINTWPAPAKEALSDLRADESAALTYTTPPLARNMELTGPGVLRIFGSSTVSNFDWAVRLTEVWPDGRSEWVGDGTLRASLRRVDPVRSLTNDAGDVVRPFYPFDRHEPVPTGEVVEYLIEIHPIANVFQAGHRLRLDIFGVGMASLDAVGAPGGGLGQVTIYRDAAHPSSVLLPLIPSRCQDATPALESMQPLAPCAATLEEALS